MYYFMGYWDIIWLLVTFVNSSSDNNKCNKLAFQMTILSCLSTKIRRCAFAMQAGTSGQLLKRYVRVYTILLKRLSKSRQLSNHANCGQMCLSHWCLIDWLVSGY